MMCQQPLQSVKILFWIHHICDNVQTDQFLFGGFAYAANFHAICDIIIFRRFHMISSNSVVSTLHHRHILVTLYGAFVWITSRRRRKKRITSKLSYCFGVDIIIILYISVFRSKLTILIWNELSCFSSLCSLHHFGHTHYSPSWHFYFVFISFTLHWTKWVVVSFFFLMWQNTWIHSNHFGYT